jgi:hypothetical protein
MNTQTSQAMMARGKMNRSREDDLGNLAPKMKPRISPAKIGNKNVGPIKK